MPSAVNRDQPAWAEPRLDGIAARQCFEKARFMTEPSTAPEKAPDVAETVGFLRRFADLMATGYNAAYLRRAGIDLAKVNFVELPFPAQAAALTRGQIAAGLCVEPFMPGAIDEIRLLASGTETIGPKFATAGWLSTPKWISENRAVAHRFAAVMYDTARWANDNANTARKNEILAKITRMEPAMLTRMVHATYSTALNPAEFDPWLEWAYRVKFIDKPVRARDLIERV